MKKASFLLGFASLFLAASSVMVFAEPTAAVGSLIAEPRIVNAIDETNLIEVHGSAHPLARAEYDRGPVPENLPMQHMLLQLQRGPQEERALQSLLEQLQNPHSANYHHWLNADDFGHRFGPAQPDIEMVMAWLQSHGLQVNVVYPSGMVMDISGTAGQIRDVFHTEIHNYNLKGETHIANASNVKIPAALAPVVLGVTSLNDFRPHAMVHKAKPAFDFNVCFTSTDCDEFYDITPADFATIYNINPLRSSSNPITGKGQTITTIEDSDIQEGDWQRFRAVFGLSSYSGKFTQVHPKPPSGSNNCTDPGRNGDEVEAALDTEWSGAVAPDADIQLASCATAVTGFGTDIAALNLLNSTTPPPILSVSYGDCEAYLGPAGNALYNSLWEQAATEGVSVYVAAGDWGAVVCDAGEPYSVTGVDVSGFASTPYNVAVGGTDTSDFVDGTTSTYWSSANGKDDASVLSYIPETTWNNSCAGSVLYQHSGYSSGTTYCNSAAGASFYDVTAGSGGPSFVYSKPSWQSGVYGIQNDGQRDLPDVSLFASNAFWFTGYLLCMSDTAVGGVACDYTNSTDALDSTYGGTSFAAPEFAGIQALINQKLGSQQGNPNPTLYSLAAAEYGSASKPNHSNLNACNASKGNKIGSTCTFYDVTSGNIDVPCYGINNCYTPAGDTYGVLSKWQKSLGVAYPAAAGWDFATGLGTVNVTNLVNAWF
jgi:subtilase family serine protease